MTTYEVCTRKYDLDLKKLLSRRISQCGCLCGLCGKDDGVTVTVREEEATLFYEAVLLLLSRDLMYFEMAAYVDSLPLELEDKRLLLQGALRAGEKLIPGQQEREALAQYLAEHDMINLEGYLSFRMGGQLRLWQQTVDKAVVELSLQKEYAQLLGALNAYVRAKRPRVGELSVCLNPDGSCTLTDDSDARIEYVDCSDDGLISLLIGMAPAFLTVYDLSGGNGKRMTEAIRRVFAGRVKIYR